MTTRTHQEEDSYCLVTTYGEEAVTDEAVRQYLQRKQAAFAVLLRERSDEDSRLSYFDYVVKKASPTVLTVLDSHSTCTDAAIPFLGRAGGGERRLTLGYGLLCR
jgi:hypothetical protein